uniref:Uncharacterized protein n=1 Tax=Candidatus Kentrum sp. SD TaxID=2126332 RepID=A0A450YUZ1_9GAMM|nr:MAG: hypothetical protein BECKSD772F_GA0070984_105010 [Candidatus Kentron sp. SD]VFK45368.1 MAG: hypothetical protein BECKSD772E_GA0070983_10529 [Candidatus Kentron sp. SD]VFK79531.1 MAG: hypothetical protein BECKSD772D_GA0070982_105311 [Candidatus Kentron sp. SD]
METERPKTVYEKIWWGSVEELEQSLMEIFEQKKPELLENALNRVVTRCAVYLAKGEVTGFAEVGQRLGRAMRRSGFPQTWAVEDHPLVRLHGQIQGIARISARTGEMDMDDEAKAFLRRSKHAKEIIQFLSLKRGAKFSDIQEKLRDTSGNQTPGVDYPLKRLVKTGLIRQYESSGGYELTYLGRELAVQLMSPPLEEWDVNEVAREFQAHLAALAERSEELKSLDPEIRKEMEAWLKEQGLQIQKVLRALEFPEQFILPVDKIPAKRAASKPSSHSNSPDTNSPEHNSYSPKGFSRYPNYGQVAQAAYA